MSESHVDTLLGSDRAIISDDRLAGLAIMLGAESSCLRIGMALKEQSLQLISSKISYVRYKPSTSCIIGYRLRHLGEGSDEEIESYAYVKCYAPENFTNAADKAQDQSAAGPIGRALMNELASILYPVWSDKELAGIELAFTPRKLARSLRDGLTEFPESHWRLSDKKLTAEIVRYKPERRAVVKLETRVKERTTGEKIPVCVYGRCYADNRAAQIGPLMTTLAEQGAKLDQPVIIPRPISYLREKETLLVRAVAGRPLSEKLDRPEALVFARKAGVALSWLHSVSYENLDSVSGPDFLSEVSSTAESLKQIMPSEVGLVEEITRVLITHLGQAPDYKAGLIHGDFYADQLLVTAIEQPLAVIDFDRAANGNRMVDLANFCADLRLMKIWNGLDQSDQLECAFLVGYNDRRPESVTLDQIETLIVAQMLKQVVAPFRRWEKDWKEKIRIGLESCRKMLR